MRHKMRTIRSVKHKLQSFEINKISLSCFDDKCYIHDNGTSSYAYGHYKINKLMNNTFSKYRPPYFWTRYRSFFTFQNIGLHTPGTRYDLLK